jgi:hypothetical protein
MVVKRLIVAVITSGEVPFPPIFRQGQFRNVLDAGPDGRAIDLDGSKETWVSQRRGHHTAPIFLWAIGTPRQECRRVLFIVVTKGVVVNKSHWRVLVKPEPSLPPQPRSTLGFLTDRGELSG